MPAFGAPPARRRPGRQARSTGARSIGAVNRLADETSPYLRQHADNPVDWYPWGDEAFARAAELDRPVFLSIGYASCHWCHVMAHESFEDPEVAELLARSFVAVKVDREERPDVDSVYMSAVQALTGSGGWPMSMFCTPDGRPFYGGTYYPPTDRAGLPSFRHVLGALAEAWTDRRDEVEEQAEALLGAVRRDVRLTDGLAPDPGTSGPPPSTSCSGAWWASWPRGSTTSGEASPPRPSSRGRPSSNSACGATAVTVTATP